MTYAEAWRQAHQLWGDRAMAMRYPDVLGRRVYGVGFFERLPHKSDPPPYPWVIVGEGETWEAALEDAGRTSRQQD